MSIRICASATMIRVSQNRVWLPRISLTSQRLVKAVGGYRGKNQPTFSRLCTRSRSVSTCSSSYFEQRPSNWCFRYLLLIFAKSQSVKSLSTWSSQLKSEYYFLVFLTSRIWFYVYANLYMMDDVFDVFYIICVSVWRSLRFIHFTFKFGKSRAKWKSCFAQRVREQYVNRRAES